MSERGERFLRNSEPELAWRRDVRAPFVGASVLQTPGAVRSEMQKIDGEIMATDVELEAAARAHGMAQADDDTILWAHPAAAEVYKGTNKIARFYVDAWVPFRRAWHDWYHDNKPPTFLSRPLSWLGSLAWNEAPTAEAYQRNLLGLRETARKLGVKLHSPEPDIEGMSFADPRRPGVGDAIDELATIAKYALYGGLILGGTFGVVEIIKAARTK